MNGNMNKMGVNMQFEKYSLPECGILDLLMHEYNTCILPQSR